MIGRQLLAFTIGNQLAASDAQQRIMGLEIVGRRKIGLVGRDQRQTARIGQIDQSAFGAALFLNAVALQLDIKSVAERLQQALAARSGERGLIGGQCQGQRPLRPTT